MRKEDKRVGLGVLAVVGLVLTGGGWAQQFLGTDYRATRTCPKSYWTCETEVVGQALIGWEETEISFEGEARACIQNGAWEASVRRTRFTCAASGMVKPSSCEAVETTCDLPGGRLYDL